MSKEKMKDLAKPAASEAVINGRMKYILISIESVDLYFEAYEYAIKI